MGLLGLMENLVANYETKIQQLEQQLQIAQQTIQDLQKQNEPIKEVVELEDK